MATTNNIQASDDSNKGGEPTSTNGAIINRGDRAGGGGRGRGGGGRDYDNVSREEGWMRQGGDEE